jgi:hypothetical protein
MPRVCKFTYNAWFCCHPLLSLSWSDKRGKATIIQSTGDFTQTVARVKALTAYHVFSVAGRPVAGDSLDRVKGPNTVDFSSYCCVPAAVVCGRSHWIEGWPGPRARRNAVPWRKSPVLGVEPRPDAITSRTWVRHLRCDDCRSVIRDVQLFDCVCKNYGLAGCDSVLSGQ